MYAADPDLATFTTTALQTITILGSVVAGLVMLFGAIKYITSSGKIDQLESAKRTITRALLGLVLLLGAGLGSSLFTSFLTTPAAGIDQSELILQQIQPVTPTDGLTELMLDALTSVLRNVVESATTPLINAALSYVTNTPSLVANATIFKFWLMMVGIADSLLVLVIALLGLHVMSATTFGFEELEIKQLLPKIGLAFLGIHLSIFLIDGLVQLNNALVHAVLVATGGIEQAWLFTAYDPLIYSVGGSKLVTLLFFLLFIVLLTILILFYVTRLILLALGAAFSPFLFLLWVLPKGSDFAEISAKNFLVVIFSIFVQVVMIQLASTFLTFGTENVGDSILSLLVGIGLLLALLKTPGTLASFAFYTTSSGLLRNLTTKMMNVNMSAPAAAKQTPSETITPTKQIHVRK